MSFAAKGRDLLEGVGAGALSAVAWFGGLAVLLARTARGVVRGLLHRRSRSRRGALARQMVRVGIRSLPVVILVQLFIGLILALQMTPPLEPFGQEDKVPMIIGVAGFRMLGPIITAVVLSGFAGASIAAEIGTMVVTEEIEAMEATALSPIRFLVVPRVLATVIMTVLLAVIADWMIAAGGWATARLSLGPEVYEGYWRQMREQLQLRDFGTGLVMAAVFGLLISLIACFEGFRVRGGAEGVGRATTMTVVYSIEAIVLAAAVFTMIFYVFGL